MRIYSQLNDFYRDTPFRQLRAQLMLERVNDRGELLCEYCGKPILKKYDCIAHHVIPLTHDNLYDINISLNPDNIQLVHHTCHNAIHERWGYGKPQRVFVVYGAPCSGKSSYVQASKEPGDFVVDLDSIWQSVSGDKRYIKDNRLKEVVFAIQREQLELVKMRVGSWRSAWIIGGYPFPREREDLCKRMAAEPILIEATKEECLSRLYADECRIGVVKDWERYIDEWFSRAE